MLYVAGRVADDPGWTKAACVVHATQGLGRADQQSPQRPAQRALLPGERRQHVLPPALPLPTLPHPQLLHPRPQVLARKIILCYLSMRIAGGLATHPESSEDPSLPTGGGPQKGSVILSMCIAGALVAHRKLLFRFGAWRA